MTGCCLPPGSGRRRREAARRPQAPGAQEAAAGAPGGGVRRLRPGPGGGLRDTGPIGGGETAADGAPVTALPTFSFGLTAYAADTGERYEANANGGLAFSAAGASRWSAEGGHYTGCLFQVTGENIQTISLAIDREALYRSRTLTDLPREEVQKYLEAEASGTEYQLPGGDDVINASLQRRGRRDP